MQNKTGNIGFYVYNDLYHCANGTPAFISNINTRAEQHIQYLPYGELFVSQRNSTIDSRYKFTGKEHDTELRSNRRTPLKIIIDVRQTNYTYFGARYYDSDASIWLSVDPMASERSWVSPYSYCQNSPIIRTDPTGALDWIPPSDGSGNWTAEQGDGYWRLSEQAGIPLGDAKNAVITANQNRGQARTSETMVYPGDVVNVVTGTSAETNNATEAYNFDYYNSYPQGGNVEPVSVAGVLIDLIIREPMQNGLEYLGMGEEAAYWTSTGITVGGSLFLAFRGPKIMGSNSKIKYSGNNPNKAPKGYQWKGKPNSTPGSKSGNYYNAKTRETLRPDLNHPDPIGPHWDYRNSTGSWFRIHPDGTVKPK
jgi:RHS repeat-associated protein